VAHARRNVNTSRNVDHGEYDPEPPQLKRDRERDTPDLDNELHAGTV
jgi:hypothetical protein